jgi:hypothetical protein
MAASKLAIVERRLEELQRLRAELAQWISDCDANASEADCPVIEHLEARS